MMGAMGPLPAAGSASEWFPGPGLAPSGDTSGVTDTANIQGLLNLGSSASLQGGTFYVNCAGSFTANAQQVYGAGEGATVIALVSSFSGSAAFSCAGYNDCGVRDLTIESASGAWSTAPAASGIEVAHSQRFRIRDVRGLNLNGYLAEIVSDPAGDSYYPVLDHVTASFCKAGAHLQGTSSSDHLMGAFLVNCTFEECEDADGLFCEDVIDVTCVNLECSPAASPTGSGTPGSGLHIKGDSNSHFYASFDLGGEVSGAASANPAVLVEPSGSGSPSGIFMTGGVAEFGTPGISMTAGSVTLSGVHIGSNGTYGLEMSGTGIVSVTGCIFDGNNSGGGTGYDLYWNSAGTGAKLLVQASIFNTPLGSGDGKVAAACSIGSGTGTSDFFNNRFNAATAFVSGGGFPTLARSNVGYNPVGYISSPPAVPASGTAQSNSEGADMTVVVTANSGSTCGVEINGHTVATIPASGVLAVPLAHSMSITLTYTGTAPTWAWYGS